MDRVETEWRFLRGWSPKEIELGLAQLAHMKRGFLPHDAAHWNSHRVRERVACEEAGSTGPVFQSLKNAVRDFVFSDPRIVCAYFDHHAELLGRRMLLELKSMGVSYLCGTVVAETIDEEKSGAWIYGYRYDTLANHIECGMEWFRLIKDTKTGEIFFEIEAWWRPGHFPNLWSRVGFHVLSPVYRKIWHREAFARLSAIARGQKRFDDFWTAVAAGAATGMRSFSALSRLARGKHHRLERVVVAALALEVIADKLPVIPDRTKPSPLLSRIAIGAFSAAVATSRKRYALVGGVAALGTSFAASALRKSPKRFAGKKLVVALLEDALMVRTRARLV